MHVTCTKLSARMALRRTQEKSPENPIERERERERERGRGRENAASGPARQIWIVGGNKGINDPSALPKLARRGTTPSYPVSRKIGRDRLVLRFHPGAVLAGYRIEGAGQGRPRPLPSPAPRPPPAVPPRPPRRRPLPSRPRAAWAAWAACTFAARSRRSRKRRRWRSPGSSAD
jgi:hypothetical protein